MVTKKKLSKIKGLSDAKVDKIREALLQSCGNGSVFCTALEVAVKRKNCFHIATGKFWFNKFFRTIFWKKEQNNAFSWRIIYNKATLSLRSLLSKPARLTILRKHSQIFPLNYRKVASRSTSRLVARSRIFWLFMKGKFDPYVLWPLACDLWPLNSGPVYCSRLYGRWIWKEYLWFLPLCSGGFAQGCTWK